MSFKRGGFVKRDDSTRVNERIRIPEIRLIGSDGKQYGIFQTRDAMVKAREEGLDLVEISPNARPPVCKIMDYGKFKYEQSKKAHEAKKKQTVIHVKEMKLRPTTGEHDIQVKLAHVKRFLEDGDKAKITMRFKGREMAHMDVGITVLKRMIDDLKDMADIDQEPTREGRSVSAILAPKKK